MNSPVRIVVAASAILLGSIVSLCAGTFSISSWTGDADSGISLGTNFTTVVDFNGTGSTSVNGVNFTNTGASGATYQLLGANDTFANNANNLPLGSGSTALASTFLYSGNTAGNASLTIGNLVAGQTYTTTWYNVGFGNTGDLRQVNITPGDTGIPFLYDENQAGSGNGNLLKYTFVAAAPQITFGFDAVVDADSFHHYALTNAGPSGTSASLQAVTPTYVAQSGASPFAPFTVKNNDLLQTHLASAVGSGGDFAKEGTGGVAALTNGAFSITGTPQSNPELATGNNNSSVLFTLDLTGAPQGYDISQIVGYGGWNDQGRDRQLYSIYYSVVGDSGFTFLGTANFDNPANPSQPSAISSNFDVSLGWVDAIRIDFLNGQENGYAGYGEFDVVGVAHVPEPGSAGLLMLGLGAIIARRRARR